MALSLVPAAVRRGLAGRTLTIRSSLLRFPAVRAAVGLAVGFGAAAVTFLAVDRYGTDVDAELRVVVQENLDHDGYCATIREGGRALRVADDAEGWRCGGFVNGMWSPVRLDFEALCVWQFGESAVPRENTPDGAFSTVCIVPG